MGLYEDLVDFLFDGAVPVETIRKIDDASEMHVMGNLKTTAHKKKKAWDEKSGPEKIGVGTSVLGAVSGPAAIYGAVQSAKEGKGGMPRGALRSWGGERGKKVAAYLDSPKSRNAKIAAGAAGAGLVGLQTANWIGDSVNTRVLSRSKNEMIDDVTEKKVKKSIQMAVDAGLSEDEILKAIRGPRNPANIARNGQRIVGAALAGGSALGGYAIGRKQTDKSVDEALDERGVKPLTFKPIRRANYGTAPVVVSSSHKPKKEVKKSDDVDMVWEGEVSKFDDDKRLVFGWCSLSTLDGEPVVDKQGDWIPIEETEKSAYEYVIKSRKGGDMHSRDGEMPLHVSDMVESMVFTDDKIAKMGLPDDFPRGWWVGFKVNDGRVWEEVKKNEKVHFSIHGKGKRVQKEI